VNPPVTTAPAGPCPALVPRAYCGCARHALYLSLASTPGNTAVKNIFIDLKLCHVLNVRGFLLGDYSEYSEHSEYSETTTHFNSNFDTDNQMYVP
jgi:hypothetical protein